MRSMQYVSKPNEIINKINYIRILAYMLEVSCQHGKPNTICVVATLEHRPHQTPNEKHIENDK